MTAISQVLRLESIGNDRFTGPVVPSRIGRTFGGQLVAQALAAAQETIEGKQVHSVHAYFVGPGDSSAPVDIAVERLRDGRSFSNRQVRLTQSGRLLFVLTASFRVCGQVGPEHQDRMPDVPDPDEAAALGGGAPYSTRIILQEWNEWDIRLVPQDGRDPAAAETTGSGFRHVWFRNTSDVPADPAFHAAGLAYMSDMTLIRSALIEHQGDEVQLASLDHAIWYLRPPRIDEWLLYEQVSPFAHAGTGLAQGKLFSRSGELVAVVMQEGLMRTVRGGEEPGAANGNWKNV